MLEPKMMFQLLRKLVAALHKSLRVITRRLNLFSSNFAAPEI